MAKIASNKFVTVRSEGGLLPPDLLARIAASDPDLGGLKPEDYGLAKGERLNEAASRAWARCKTYWAAFGAAAEGLGPAESGVTETREQWLLPFFRELGYGRLTFQSQPERVEERSYHLSHRAGETADAPPIHTLGCRQEIDRASGAGEAGAGPRRVSAHGLVQEYLNRTDHLWGIVTNGRRLRLLRDNASLTRPAFLEFDLEAMMEGGNYADFALLFLLLHRSRLPRGTADASSCRLEKWREAAQREGTRALGDLRAGVEAAIRAFGRGLLAHPENEVLRERLRSGALSVTDYYRQLLRLVYRLLFLLVAEERDLLFPDTATARAREVYAEYYSVSRLRDLAEQWRRGDSHDDLWRGLRVTFDALTHGSAALGLEALNGGLFDPATGADVDRSLLENADLLDGVRALSRVKAGKTVRRVNYRDMDVEELGSVYESLLDYHPVLDTSGIYPAFILDYGSERKTTGSYYTPPELVHELIKSALEPVIARALASAATPEGKRKALLELTVCDPACGSGHFLLAAARRIGKELARLRTGEPEPDPAQVRDGVREAIRHCIYGVDLNPLAVDLCKVALWLEGHTPGKPLPFLDHHIQCGNSLVGVPLPRQVDALFGELQARSEELQREEVRRSMPPRERKAEQEKTHYVGWPLSWPDEAFNAVTGDDKAVAAAMKRANKQDRAGQIRLALGIERLPDAGAGDQDAREAREIAELPDDRAEQVHAKESRYHYFRDTAQAAKILAADTWTALFFWPLRADTPPPPTQDQLAALHLGRNTLTPAQHDRVAELALQSGFFHWHLVFPDVFRDKGGFDCVLGNPPWEMLQLDPQEFFAGTAPYIADAANMAARERLIARLAVDDPQLYAKYQSEKHATDAYQKFVHAGGRFPLTSYGRINLMALFAELARQLLSPRGRASVIVPTGIATELVNQFFFADLIERHALVSLLGFENEAFLFPGVDHRFKFCVVTLAGQHCGVDEADFSFFFRRVSDIEEPQRHFTLTAEEIALLNPNTRTCPIFRTSADAELTKAVYRRVPVLVDERTGEDPWGFRGMLMFMMNTDSGLFRTEPGPCLVPLYEAKLMHQFDHRYGSYESRGSARGFSALPETALEQYQDPSYTIQPFYWVPRAEVEARLAGKWDREWLLAFRDITNATNERTAIFSLLPRVGVGHTAPVMLPECSDARQVATLLGGLNSLVLDYAARQKVGGTHLTYSYLKQLPVLPPDAYKPEEIDFVAARVLELVYTAWDMQPFARDLGYAGPPFGWDEERRAHLRAQLDAFYFHKYGLTEEETRYVLDPKAVYGEEFPGETFRVLKENELKKDGEYRTQRLVLFYYQAWRDGAMSQFDRWLSPRTDRPAPEPRRQGESVPAGAETRRTGTRG